MKTKFFILFITGLFSITLMTSANATTIYQKDRNERISDQGNHIWVQHVKIDKKTKAISYEAGAIAKECVPHGGQGAWLSIILYDGNDQQLGVYDNVDIADVDTPQNVKRHKASLSDVDSDDLENAAYVLPVMRGTAGCGG